MDDRAILERLVIDRWFINNNLDPGCLNAFDHVEHGVLPEVVGPGFHDKTVCADNLWLHVDDLLRDKVLAGGIGVHYRADKVLRYVLVVRQQLLRIFGQAISTIAKARVVVMVANAGIEADALDDLSRVQPLGCGIGIQLVEERHAQGEVGVGE